MIDDLNQLLRYLFMLGTLGAAYGYYLYRLWLLDPHLGIVSFVILFLLILMAFEKDRKE